MNFSTVPFFKDYLTKQIEGAGGTVYNNFEDIPKKKYRSCHLLAQYPCTTANYVQCLAANIPVSNKKEKVKMWKKDALFSWKLKFLAKLKVVSLIRLKRYSRY